MALSSRWFKRPLLTLTKEIPDQYYWIFFRSRFSTYARRCPNFHQFHGLNDRFAVGDRGSMIGGYMNHKLVLEQRQVLDWRGDTHNTEGQACAKMARHNISVGVADLCIVRVRSNGQCEIRDTRPIPPEGIGECAKRSGLHFLTMRAASERISCRDLEVSMQSHSALLGLRCDVD